MDSFVLYIIGLLVLALTYFVRDIFLTARRNSKVLADVIARLTIQNGSCKKTHELVDKEFREIKEDVNREFHGVREYIDEAFQLTINKNNNLAKD